MKVAVLKEIVAGEKRAAAVPATVEKMVAAGIEVKVQAGTGLSSGFSDGDYRAAGAAIASDADGAEVVLKVQRPADEELDAIPERAALIAYTLQARGDARYLEKLKRRGISALSLDLLPRIARAQNMDVLSSMANIAGYKSVLLAANALGKFFPMLMTAAGTVLPARVFVLGAGVAGLQAVATARRLGAVVSAFDIRPAVKEQVESLGARFVGMALDQHAEDAKGYAKEVSADTARKEKELLVEEMKATDACITTALVPGRRAPVLVTAEMVEAMRPGSVIVDLAAEQGGNCQLTEAGKEIVHQGVTILGPVDIPRPSTDLVFLAADSTAELARIGVLRPSLVPDGAIWIVSRKGRARTLRDVDVIDVFSTDGATVVLPEQGQLIDLGLIGDLYVFVLAGFLGYQVISRVSPLLHTPLMSATNAISGISLVGSLVVAGAGYNEVSTLLGFVAVTASTINVVGGFLITDRILKMFRAGK